MTSQTSSSIPSSRSLRCSYSPDPSIVARHRYENEQKVDQDRPKQQRKTTEIDSPPLIDRRQLKSRLIAIVYSCCSELISTLPLKLGRNNVFYPRSSSVVVGDTSESGIRERQRRDSCFSLSSLAPASCLQPLSPLSPLLERGGESLFPIFVAACMHACSNKCDTYIDTVMHVMYVAPRHSVHQDVHQDERTKREREALPKTENGRTLHPFKQPATQTKLLYNDIMIAGQTQT